MHTNSLMLFILAIFTINSSLLLRRTGISVSNFLDLRLYFLSSPKETVESHCTSKKPLISSPCQIQIKFQRQGRWVSACEKSSSSHFNPARYYLVVFICEITFVSKITYLKTRWYIKR
tara:strand:+ start:227 stop:580 length:354 start_codon:yes stop_codon:yes gene_type:complete